MWYTDRKIRDISLNMLWKWLKNTAYKRFERIPPWDDVKYRVPARIIDIKYDEDDLYVGSCTVEYYASNFEGKIIKVESLFSITTIMESFSSKANGINRHLESTDKWHAGTHEDRTPELQMRKEWKKVTEFLEADKTIKYNPDYIYFDNMPADARKYYEFLVKKNIYRAETRGQEGELVDSVIDYGRKHPEQVLEYIRYGQIHSGKKWSEQFRRRFAPQYLGIVNNPAEWGPPVSDS